MNEVNNLKDKLIEQLELNNDLLIRINKAMEFMNKNIELNNGALSNREEFIASKHDLIRDETKLLNCLINILRGDK